MLFFKAWLSLGGSWHWRHKMKPPIVYMSTSSLLEPATWFDDSTKWTRLGAAVLPFWVADMDFKAAEPIQSAVCRRAATGSYGYATPSLKLKEAIIANCRECWNAESCDPKWIRFHPGLICGLYQAVRLAQGGGVIVPVPIYPPFLNAARDTASAIRLVDVSKEDSIFENIEKAVCELKAQGQNQIVILWCSPHNPTGRVWRRSELEHLANIVRRHADEITAVCSDEVWSGLVFDDTKTPFVSLAELAFSANYSDLLDRLVILTSPSKTYNVAALDFAFAVIPNDSLRRRYFRVGRDQAECTPLGLAAAEAILVNDLHNSSECRRRDILTPHNGKCEPWRRELVQFLQANRDYTIDFIHNHCAPDVYVAAIPEASYLIWLDCNGLGLSNPAAYFRDQFYLGLSDGDPFFGKVQSGFCRFNFACPRPVLEDGLSRLAAAVESVRSQRREKSLQ